MNVKQQKQIGAFLINEFGSEEGSALSDKQEKMLVALIENTRNKTKSQMKTLIQTILRCIALYKVLSDEILVEEKAYEYMRRYMIDVVAAKMHLSMAKLEIVPGFYFIYSRVFLKIMRTSDLHVSTQKCGKDYYDITITKCLWRTACAENGCVELCSLFCDADDVTYGRLKKIGFTRTKTLGYGRDCCDFHEYKNLKGLKKENLRDNMTTLELVLNMLAEATTTEISKQKAPSTFSENMAVAREGGEAAGIGRKVVEERTGVPVVTPENAAQLNQVVTDLLEGVAAETAPDDDDS